MSVENLLENPAVKLISGTIEMGSPISGAYTSDLLSDVMANMNEGSFLITTLSHENVIAVAEFKKAPAVIICNNAPISDRLIELANKVGISLFSTGLNQFEMSLWAAQCLTPAGNG